MQYTLYFGIIVKKLYGLYRGMEGVYETYQFLDVIDRPGHPKETMPNPQVLQGHRFKNSTWIAMMTAARAKQHGISSTLVLETKSTYRNLGKQPHKT
jgi:hypothetical protein